jgi:hypothetical protein
MGRGMLHAWELCENQVKYWSENLKGRDQWLHLIVAKKQVSYFHFMKEKESAAEDLFL